MTAHRIWIPALALITYACSANASWLSDATGINIDLAKQVQAVIAPPQTHQVAAAIVSPTPPPTPPTIAIVTDAERIKLVERIDAVRATATQNAERNMRIALGMVIFAIVLGLAASVAGFCKAALPAGILSIFATAAVGANNTLPFRDDANAYSLVSAEAYALWLQASLDLHMTPEHYDSIVSGLTLLAKRGDNKSITGSAQQLDDLMSKLHLSTSAPAEAKPDR
jgi:hypothetical protein